MKVLITEDHPVVRDGFRILLRDLWPDATVLEAEDLRGTLAMLDDAGDVDLLLIDLMLPDCSSLKGCAEIRRRHPTVTVVIVAADDSPTIVNAALGLGVLGYIPKSSPPETVRAALRMVLEGQIYVPSAVVGEHRADPTPDVHLTQRELDVLSWLATGRTNPQIAQKLGLSANTVRVHVVSILRTLNVANRMEAAKVARSGRVSGLLLPSDAE